MLLQEELFIICDLSIFPFILAIKLHNQLHKLINLFIFSFLFFFFACIYITEKFLFVECIKVSSNAFGCKIDIYIYIYIYLYIYMYI